MLRAPQPAEVRDARPSTGGVQLPFDIDLRALRIDDLHLAAALGSFDSHWKIGGDAAIELADLAKGTRGKADKEDVPLKVRRSDT